MNHLPGLLRYLREHPEVVERLANSETGLASIEIQHDGWCSLLAGTGPCDCDPAIGGIVEREWPDAE